MDFEKAVSIINKIDWSKLSNDEVEAIATVVRLAKNASEEKKENN